MIRCNIKIIFKKFLKGKRFCFYNLMIGGFLIEKKLEMAVSLEDLWCCVIRGCGK